MLPSASAAHGPIGVCCHQRHGEPYRRGHLSERSAPISAASAAHTGVPPPTTKRNQIPVTSPQITDPRSARKSSFDSADGSAVSAPLYSIADTAAGMTPNAYPTGTPNRTKKSPNVATPKGGPRHKRSGQRPAIKTTRLATAGPTVASDTVVRTCHRECVTEWRASVGRGLATTFMNFPVESAVSRKPTQPVQPSLLGISMRKRLG
jgi:hypothetical protein